MLEVYTYPLNHLISWYLGHSMQMLDIKNVLGYMLSFSKIDFINTEPAKTKQTNPI